MSSTSEARRSLACSEPTQVFGSTTVSRSASVLRCCSSVTGMSLETWSAETAVLVERRMPAISSPMQQVSAVVATRDFLLRLIDTKETPRIPREVRREARALLQHYPIASELRQVLEKGLAEKES